MRLGCESGGEDSCIVGRREGNAWQDFGFEFCGL
jgi:hypothetical protein